jgi:hypothetical protein
MNWLPTARFFQKKEKMMLAVLTFAGEVSVLLQNSNCINPYTCEEVKHQGL